MADPTKYQPGYDYSDFEQSNPTEPKPGGQLDNDFANIATSISETIDALKSVRRSDGKLANGVVTFDSLTTSIKAVLGEEQYLNIVGENIASIVTVSDNMTELLAVYSNLDEIQTVLTISPQIATVSGIASKVSDVASVAPAVALNAANMPAIQGAAANATAAAGSAGAAAGSASAAAGSATLAQRFATYPEDTDIPNTGGLRSAFHWAQKAAGAAAAALASKVSKIGDTMTGQLSIFPPDNSYGLVLERKNSAFQGVLLRLRTTDVAGGVKFGPKINLQKDGGDSWNIGLRNLTDGGISFSAGANEGQAGSERFIVTASGSIILYDGSNITTIQPDGNIQFGGQMASLFGVNLSTALSNKVSVNYTTGENDTVFPLGTTIPVGGSFGTGTPRNYLQAIYHNSNYGFATNQSNGASQLLGSWRMVGTISSIVAIFRRVQ